MREISGGDRNPTGVQYRQPPFRGENPPATRKPRQREVDSRWTKELSTSCVYRKLTLAKPNLSLKSKAKFSPFETCFEKMPILGWGLGVVVGDGGGYIGELGGVEMESGRRVFALELVLPYSLV